MLLNQPQRKLKHLLWQEHECFTSIINESQKLLEHDRVATPDTIHDLLQYREQKITELKELHYHVSGTYDGDPYSSVELDEIKDEINALAKVLVGIDAKIMDILLMMKVKCIRGMSATSSQRAELMRSAKTDRSNRRIIDIKQE